MNYKDTLLMPKTDFEMRGNLPKRNLGYEVVGKKRTCTKE